MENNTGWDVTKSVDGMAPATSLPNKNNEIQQPRFMTAAPSVESNTVDNTARPQNDFINQPKRPVLPPSSTRIEEPVQSQETTQIQEPAQSIELDTSKDSVPVVKVMNVRGLEYLMMSIALWLGAAGLIWGILSIVNGGASFNVLAMPASLALVGVPIFALLFLRLKKAELKDPSIRLSPSKRRSSHITQVLAFLVCLFNLITFVYIVFSNIGGESSVTIGKAAANLAIVMVIAGGILAYYWFNEHHPQKGA